MPERICPWRTNAWSRGERELKISGCSEIRFSSVSQLVRHNPTTAKPNSKVFEIVVIKNDTVTTWSVNFPSSLIQHRENRSVASHMEDRYGHRISYLRVSITDRCNERCNYCMPRELQEWLPREEVLSYEETLRLIRIASELGVTKVRVTGGEPLTRRNVVDFVREIPKIPGIMSLGISTNGTLLTRETAPGQTMATALREASVQSLNISLDTLDRNLYSQITGRDLHARVLEGIEAAMAAGFDQIKLNAVLMRGRNEDQLIPLIEFAASHNLILRFIEMMPVSTTEVLSEENFMPILEAKRLIESVYGSLIPETEFRTNGPATYYQIPGRKQRIGFIGAMTNLHFCENCNKLRLTCDGKLRPCLGSYLEFDIMRPLRAGASDEELKQFFLDVVDRKPEQHDFRDNYQPNRKMIAIGG